MYTNKEKALIWLTSFDLSYKKEKALLNLISADSLISDFGLNNDAKKLLGDETYNNMLDYCNKQYLDSYIEALNEKNITCLTYYSESYPEKLLSLEEPPFVLFCKGDISLLSKKAVAIVGTRSPTGYGKVVTEKFAKELAECEIVIISGLAYGVDTIAHRAALDNKGKTIAILGGGFNSIYPASNTNLAKEIEENGLLISEYKPSTEPTVYSFPYRNRIVAALSDGVMITEAGEKSGTRHTKEYAENCGRELFIVPGNITSSKSIYPNRIIKYLPTTMVTETEDVLKALGIVKKKEKTKGLQLTFEEDLIYKLLSDGEKDFEFLRTSSGMDAKTLTTRLTTLEIRGIIKKLPGNSYILKY